LAGLLFLFSPLSFSSSTAFLATYGFYSGYFLTSSRALSFFGGGAIVVTDLTLLGIAESFLGAAVFSCDCVSSSIRSGPFAVASLKVFTS